jgi:hypothetical protein
VLALLTARLLFCKAKEEMYRVNLQQRKFPVDLTARRQRSPTPAQLVDDQVEQQRGPSSTQEI